MLGGQFAVRHLASYQPTNSTLTTKLSSFYTWAVQPKLAQTTFLSYEKSGWNVSLQNRWLGSVNLKTSDNDLNGTPASPLGTQYYADSTLDSYNIVDTTISKEFDISDGKMEAFLTVNNLLDERAPLFPSGSGLPGALLAREQRGGVESAHREPAVAEQTSSQQCLRSPRPGLGKSTGAAGDVGGGLRLHRRARR
jgi:hypothetical protein